MITHEALLSAVDEAAAVGQESRSAFTHTALQAELRRRQNATKEAHRQSYLAEPEADAPMPKGRAWGESDYH